MSLRINRYGLVRLETLPVKYPLSGFDPRFRNSPFPGPGWPVAVTSGNAFDLEMPLWPVVASGRFP